MAAIDAINSNNPFAFKSINPFGGGFTPAVEPKVGTPKVGGVEGVEHVGGALAGFKAQKWSDGLSGLPTGALGEAGAVYSKLPGGQETRLGGKLNVDAFSVIPQ